ncbi:hypothetical protein GIB67_024705 [Kingdonia uniflora]|uniref:Nucleolar protein 14 n=1 Tax=Kingdonia uniflora TaxID=39325 RepID=A0A7J7NA24_9MAGN|nr:hypothetical protein GIB67_024705 [Kingdonia uniflora]
METKPNNTSTSKKKKSKKSSSSSKKLVLFGPNSVAMKTKASQKENPFETIWSRRKFDVVGKKRKGEEQRTGLARSRGIEKRKMTLLKEYKQSGKSSVFEDKRIGEQDKTLGEFDKAILRRKRQLKVDKKSKYNLSDGEEDEGAIYGGGPFLEKDDYEDDLSADNEAENNKNDKKSSSLIEVNEHSMHNLMVTGLTEGEENKHKTKKEVMEEVILKSKYFKAQKAKDKEDNEDLKEQLDRNFTSLIPSEAFLSLTQPNKMIALKTLSNKGISADSIRKEEASTSLKKESVIQEQPDDYDKLVKEMIMDIRARPSNRTKTPEELAQEEREHLEQLEEERQKRMISNEDSSDEDSDGAPDEKVRSISGDDLGDSFFGNEEKGYKKGWVDEILERDAGENENEEGGSSEDSESDEDKTDQEEEGEDGDLRLKTISVKDWEQSDDDNLSTDLVDEEEEDEDEEQEQEEEGMEGKDTHRAKKSVAQITRNEKVDVSSSKKSKLGKQQLPAQDGTLPFVIEVPASKAELCSLLDNRSDAEILEAINRIRACNAISLAAENKKKMQGFYGYLLQYFADLSNKKPLNLDLLNLLVKPLMEMSKDTPYFAAICARQRILRIRTQFCDDIRNPEKCCWPTLKTLFLLRLWSMIFPCSDFRHVVMTPAILLMCEYLMRCPIMSGRDIAIGSFLCSLVLSVVRQSQKFCPEAVIVLRILLMSAAEGVGSLPHSEINYLLELKMLKPWLRLRDSVSEIQPLNFLMVVDIPNESPFFSSDSFRASVLKSVIETLRGFVNIYGGYDSFPELFLPISTLLHEVGNHDKMPVILQDTTKDVANLIKDKVDELHMKRQPLQMCKRKAVPLKQINPMFEDNYVKGGNYDPDRERAETKKLIKRVKHEAKGAVRELRKDNHFLHEAKLKERKLLEEEKIEKYGKTRAFLQEQEHAFKSGQLGKGGKRKR